ncbi:MAG: hypothetical protein R2756_11745 [Bacteroidales bacterium]
MMLLGLFVLFNLIFPGVLRRRLSPSYSCRQQCHVWSMWSSWSISMGEDDGTATANVFISTILSIITLPLILMSLSLF